MPSGHTGKIALTMQSPVYTELGTERNGSTNTRSPITDFIGEQAVARMPLKTAKSVKFTGRAAICQGIVYQTPPCGSPGQHKTHTYPHIMYETAPFLDNCIT